MCGEALSSCPSPAARRPAKGRLACCWRGQSMSSSTLVSTPDFTGNEPLPTFCLRERGDTMGRYSQYDDYDERDRQHSFEVTCSGCGSSYSNLDGSCPNCGSGNCSYSGSDASRWNRYADREARYGC